MFFSVFFVVDQSVCSPDAFGGLRLARHTRSLVQPFPCAWDVAFLLRRRGVGRGGLASRSPSLPGCVSCLGVRGSVLEDHNFLLEKEKITKRSLKYHNGNEHIVVNHDGKGW